MAAILKSDLAQLNVNVDVQALQWTAQWDRAKSADPAKRQDIFVMYWYPDYADADSWFTNLYHSSPKPYFNLAYLDDQSLDAPDRRAPAGGGQGRRGGATRPTGGAEDGMPTRTRCHRSSWPPTSGRTAPRSAAT